jgi:hypothetical protein
MKTIVICARSKFRLTCPRIVEINPEFLLHATRRRTDTDLNDLHSFFLMRAQPLRGCRRARHASADPSADDNTLASQRLPGRDAKKEVA